MSTALAPKRRLTSAERDRFRQDLVLIGRRLYFEEGAAAVTIRRVTSEAGVAPMTFYWYFKDKEALLADMLEEEYGEAARRCREAAESAGKGPECRTRPAVRNYYGTFVYFWLARPAGIRLVFMGEAPAPRRGVRGTRSPAPDSQRHFPYFEAVVSAHFPACCAKANKLAELRTVITFQVLGFLINAVSPNAQDEATRNHQRTLVLNEIEHCIARWCAQECNTPDARFA